ncbi:MAG: lysophospholipid acyltransferase family protein [Synechococcaceae cyanobacterium]|nr:lysophospholipid acyltransferase family protein [Synechococcaceae cyanobacterium]
MNDDGGAPLSSSSNVRPALFDRPEPNLAYLVIRNLLLVPLYRVLFRGRNNGRERVPCRGGVVVVANHGSHLDPPLLGQAIGRPVAFMAKAELFRVPLLGPLIRALGAYPVLRGAGDREAIRIASDRLAQGWAVGVFLDGTRQSDGRVHDPQPGAALLAARAGVPLLPVAILGSHRALGRGQRLPRPARIHIRIGTLIEPPASRRRQDLDATTRLARDQINRLLDEGPILNRRDARQAARPLLVRASEETDCADPNR